MELDFDRCFAASSSNDSRFDGMFVTVVRTTRVYCRPSCPATPKRANVSYLPTAAAAQLAGFRACKRCRPDASPGSPEWNVRADLVARAMRLIADGFVDRVGVEGLARHLHVSERHLHRELIAEVGAGPQALSRSYRAQTARVLIETTVLPFSEVAFAAGFASIRQFNETIQKIFAATPTEMRTKHKGGTSTPGEIVLRLPFRRPFDGPGLIGFLGERAVSGVESFDGTTYARSLSLPHSSGTVELSLREEHVACALRLDDVRDLMAAVQRCRRLLDLDADATAIDEALGDDATLGPLVRANPGRRVPGAVSGFELAVRAILGQQISVKGARTLAAKLVSAYGKPLTSAVRDLSHLFPAPDAIAEADLSMLGMPSARRSTLQHLARATAAGDIDLEAGADRLDTRARLLGIPGIGPWTADLILMRALSDPDAFLPTDLGVVRALERLGFAGDALGSSKRWSPWRSYALQHLWGSLDP